MAVSLASSILAAPLDIVIIAPEDERSNTIGEPSQTSDHHPLLWYDLDEIKSHLEELLAGSPAHQGSTVTVLDSARNLLTLHRAYYTTAPGFDDFQNLENNEYDVAILINDADTLAITSTHAYEGTWQMANKLLEKGTEVYLLEPDSNSFINPVAQGFMEESANAIVNRIANGCGIHVVPAGAALDGLSEHRDFIDYIFSSSIYTTITGEGNQTNNSYSPPEIDASIRSVVETATTEAIVSEKETINYTGSFNGKSTVIHRPIETNGVINFAPFGTSTERSIQESISDVAENYRMNGTIPTTGNALGATSLNFNTNSVLLAGETQYLFTYSRSLSVDQTPLREPADTAPQPDLLPMAFARHISSGVPRPYSTGAFNAIYNEATSFNRQVRLNYGYSVPSLSIAGRIYDQYGDIENLPYVYDGVHQTALHTDAIGAGFVASAVGIDFDNDELDRLTFYHENSLYFIGWDIVMQQANLSEDRRFTPDSDLEVSTASLPVSSSSAPLAIQLVASGGTAPYSWEETTGGLPIGVSLHNDGTLSGVPTHGGFQTHNLVFKVTDVNGAIRKKGLKLETTGYNAEAMYNGWDTGYYFDTVDEGDLISGTVITALNGGNSDVIVNGINFSAHNLGGGSKSSYTGSITSTGDTGFDNLLSSVSEGSSNEGIITLSGLTTGQRYTLQVFYNNKNDADGYASQMIANIDGIGDITLRGSNNGNDNADYGSYGVAHFIASSSTVQLSLEARSDRQSIKGIAAFNALLLTQQPANSLHTGTTRHAEISWTTPVEATGLQDLIEGVPVKALNGGTSNIAVDILGVTFEATSIGLEADEPNGTTLSYGSSTFANLISEQTRTKRHSSLTFDNLTVGQRYQIQIFNKSRSIAEYSHTELYRGSDTFFGLPNQRTSHIFEDGKVMQSVGTFTAQSTSQVIELNSNDNDLVQDVAFSAMYLVAAEEFITILDDGSNQAPTIMEINGSDSSLINFNGAVDNFITSFTASDPDAGDILRYSIVSGNENAAFRINSLTGDLSLVDNPVGSATGTYIIDVMVTDNKIPAGTAIIRHTIQPITSEDTDGDGFSDAVEAVHGTNFFDATIQPFLLGYWDFNDPSIPTLARGALTSPDGSIAGGAEYTADGGGFSGQAGDYAMDCGETGNFQRMTITDLDVINTAAKNDSISFSWWQLTRGLVNSAALEFAGPDFSMTIYNPRTETRSGLFVNDERVFRDGPSVDVWTHYTLCKDGTVIRFWIDGVAEPNDSTPTPISETLTRIVFGARLTNGANSIRGIMDDFAIYNGPLTQDQVTILAEGGSPLDLIDSDADGLSDSWEQLHFGNISTADENSDTDGDGQNDRAEFIAGTAPTEQSSLLSINQIAVQRDSGTLSWKGKRNRIYRLSFSEDLTVWTLLDGEYIVENDNDEIVIDISDDVNGLPDRGFYRVEVGF